LIRLQTDSACFGDLAFAFGLGSLFVFAAFADMPYVCLASELLIGATATATATIMAGLFFGFLSGQAFKFQTCPT
jgi:hypothetical protein